MTPPATAQSSRCRPALNVLLSAAAFRAAASAPAYKLHLDAKGKSFFDAFQFAPEDFNHGASNYMPSYEAAREAGVVDVFDSHTILRAGARSVNDTKRDTVKIITKDAWKHFLVAMRFSHLPWGCGVWPSFFTLGRGVDWPMGGEVDILEYANDAGQMSSFHTGKECKLDPDQVNKYGPMPDQNLDGNNGSNYNCLTKYCAGCTSLGCAPNTVPLLMGRDWSTRAGAIAMERTSSFVKIFFIPDEELPSDLLDGEPAPDAWDKWIISYYPLADSPECPDADGVMAPQELILNIAFCGDWASKAWGGSEMCSHKGPAYNKTATEKHQHVDPKLHQCRAVDPLAEYAPAEDCCTQFIVDSEGEYGTDDYLKDNAFYNISWFKVFTRPEAAPLTTAYV